MIKATDARRSQASWRLNGAVLTVEGDKMIRDNNKCRETQQKLIKSIEIMSKHLENAIIDFKQCKANCETKDWELDSPEEIEKLLDRLRQMILKLRLKIS